MCVKTAKALFCAGGSMMSYYFLCASDLDSVGRADRGGRHREQEPEEEDRGVPGHLPALAQLDAAGPGHRRPLRLQLPREEVAAQSELRSALQADERDGPDLPQDEPPARLLRQPRRGRLPAHQRSQHRGHHPSRRSSPSSPELPLPLPHPQPRLHLPRNQPHRLAHAPGLLPEPRQEVHHPRQRRVRHLANPHQRQHHRSALPDPQEVQRVPQDPRQLPPDHDQDPPHRQRKREEVHLRSLRLTRTKKSASKQPPSSRKT